MRQTGPVLVHFWAGQSSDTGQWVVGGAGGNVSALRAIKAPQILKNKTTLLLHNSGNYTILGNTL